MPEPDIDMDAAATASGPATSASEPLPDRIAPLHRLERSWLDRWTERLDPRHQPSVSAAARVAWALRAAGSEPEIRSR